LFKSRWFIAAILYALFTRAVSAQDRAPAWLLDTEPEYPSSRYVAATGEGKTRAEAETAAVTAISLFFGTKTEIRKEAIREFNETTINTTAGFSKKTYIGESALIKSEEEFLGIRFAPPRFDPQRQTWTVLAYINRREAGEIYESRINANMSAVNALIEDAEREKEAIYACALLYGGLPIAGITEEYIQNTVLVDSGSARKYDAALAVLLNACASSPQASRSEARQPEAAPSGIQRDNVTIDWSGANLGSGIPEWVQWVRTRARIKCHAFYSNCLYNKEIR
jgi:hypothetical protein